ncbi:glycosyl transferase family 39 [Crinalium epipsammum PCC 9333]|uniref:Glycosyl transferase family 39 n=1 Tax=Crinalium epipsammum PCC 9333 TaxID=1173022 RepID=K9VYG1_9CYAN|nr:glycosyltransferase family 39 protein [Crinalium epipsammum]AFZ12564.1 glycosyl transferase family 39 [Crinalium epipsammum PCC 9333]
MNLKVKSWLELWDKQPNKAWTLSILWLLLISWIAFLWNLGNTGLIDETEPLFAEASRQITVTGNWITPYFNGVTRFDKPILIYWCQAIAYKLIGVNSWAVRLPSALAAIALTVLGFYTLRYFGIPNPGKFQEASPAIIKKDPHITRQLWLSASIGAAMIALNPETIAWGRTGVSDMLLSGCTGSALLAFFLGYAQDSKPQVQERWYIAFYVLVALAVLTKGPVGIVVPLLIISTFLLYLGKFREVIQEMRPVRGFLLFAAITMPWYVLVFLANGENFINSFFGYHNIERFTGVVNGHRAPWYFYFLVVLVGFAPWSIYLPVAIARLRFWQRKSWQQQPRATHLGLFAWFWFAGIFAFFTIAITKLPSYVLPLMPAAAIIVALFWSDQINRALEVKEPNKKAHSSLLWSGVFNVLFLLIIAGAIFFLPLYLGYDPAVPNLRELLQQAGLPVSGGIIWALTAVGLAIVLIKRYWHLVWGINLVGFIAFIIFVITPAYFLMDHTRQLPLRELAALSNQVEKPGEELIMIGFKKPSLVFYSHQRVNYFNDPTEAIEYIRTKATNQPNSPSSLIIAQPELIQETKLKPNQYQDLGSSGAYQLIRVDQQLTINN